MNVLYCPACSVHARQEICDWFSQDVPQIRQWLVKTYNADLWLIQLSKTKEPLLSVKSILSIFREE